ncbi:uncharacterized protein LOC144446252 [Glandiceps talaboti]
MWKICLAVVYLLVAVAVTGFQPLPAMRLQPGGLDNGNQNPRNMERGKRPFMDPPKVRYEQRVDSILEETYKWQENKRAAILCPKGTFIAEIAFIFSGMKRYFGSNLKRFKLTDLPHVSTTNREIVLKRRTGEPKAKGFWNANIGEDDSISSCDPVLFCLGHQACLFKVTIDVCANDPMPGQRKILDMRVSCVPDNLFSKYFYDAVNTNNELSENVMSRQNKILYLYINDDNTDDLAVSLIQVPMTEDELFGIGCPEPKEAYSKGYGGVCTIAPPQQIEMVNTLWPVLGRVPSAGCRKELIDAYCSYHYNISGGCIPPALLQQSEQSRSPDDPNLRFSFKSLPLPGPRPDLTEHKQLITLPHANLIPARLAFALLVHEMPDTVMQLLRSIYKPYFYYCIHVDKRAEEIRQMLIERTQFADNIHILPRERSFVASWGSYEIVRAELECFEELVRMGAWDFIINLSGADLPIRDVDDVAAALAPARGHTFLRKNGRWRDRKNKATDYTVWYSCDAHVYNASYRGDRPVWADMYSASQWGVYGRNFAEFVVSPDRGYLINNLQYFAQTCIIPDESYMMSNLMISDYRSTYLPGHLHHLKNFDSRDEFGFCRHTEDIDFCGQGPGIFEPADLPKLKTFSFDAMFARKFDHDPRNQVRKEVLEWVDKGFYESMDVKIGRSTIREIIHKAVLHHYGEDWEKSTSFDTMVSYKIFPQFYHSNPCCRPYYSARNNLVHEVRYWVDFRMDEINTNGNKTAKTFRAAVSPRAHSECFSNGHLRALQISGVSRAVGKISAAPTEKQIYVPYEAVRSTLGVIHLNALFKVPRSRDEDVVNPQCDDNVALTKLSFKPIKTQNYNHARFKISFNQPQKDPQVETLEFNATLFDPYGNIRCSRIMKFTHTVPSIEQEAAKKGKPGPDVTTYSNSFSNCGVIDVGLWRARLVQLKQVNPFPYVTSVYIARKHPDTDEVKGVPDWLWEVEGVTELPDNGNFYDVKDMPMNPLDDDEGEEFYAKKYKEEDFEEEEEIYANKGDLHIVKRNYDHEGKSPQDQLEEQQDKKRQDKWVRRAMGHHEPLGGRVVNVLEGIGHKRGKLLNGEEMSYSLNSQLEKFLKILLISTIVVVVIKKILNPMRVMKRGSSGAAKFFVFVIIITFLQFFLYTMLFSL